MSRRTGNNSRAKAEVIPQANDLANASTLHLLHNAYLSYHELLGEAAKKYYDQTPGMAVILSLIAQNEGVSAAQLAKRLSVAPQSINVHITALIERGLIQCEVNADNRRANKLSISPEGRKALKAAKTAFTKAEAAVFSCMNEAARAQLRPVLVQLIEAVEAYRDKAEQPKARLKNSA